MTYTDFILILKVQAGKVVNSATTIDERPRLAKAPRKIPQGKCNIREAVSFDTGSSDAYRSNHLNLKSDKTKTPR